ncbi:hypothetical protein AB0L70_40530 [Kribbella sp. NPDC051952]|uniref:hypothetical protein n=1 Tax=Kribbella sp. NPDC051952 TaxID=3154851 RepID=UPI0034293DB4
MQLTVHWVMAVLFAGAVVGQLVLKVWPGAVIWAVPTLGLFTRVVVLMRIRRLGWYADDETDRPSVAVVNRETSKIFVVQLVGWLIAAVYLALVHVWLGLAVAVVLAYTSLVLVRFMRRSPKPS